MIFSHVTQIRVRYADTDKMGVVYNGNYLTYFEVGRTELMRFLGLPYTKMEEAGYILPLLESHVNYKQSAFYDDILQVRATIDLTELSSTIRFDYEVYVNDSFIASGWTIHAYVLRENMRPVRPPKIINELIEKLKK